MELEQEEAPIGGLQELHLAQCKISSAGLIAISNVCTALKVTLVAFWVVLLEGMLSTIQILLGLLGGNRRFSSSFCLSLDVSPPQFCPVDRTHRDTDNRRNAESEEIDDHDRERAPFFGVQRGVKTKSKTSLVLNISIVY